MRYARSFAQHGAGVRVPKRKLSFQHEKENVTPPLLQVDLQEIQRCRRDDVDVKRLIIKGIFGRLIGSNPRQRESTILALSEFYSKRTNY